MAAFALTGSVGLLAIAACAVALTALLACALLARSLRRLRRAQRLVLGDGSQRDLIAHGASLQEAFGALQEYVGEVAQRIDTRLMGVEQALETTIKHRALVRYDAYNELSGQQSVSIALLDDRRSGVVISCIHHREQARVYAKRIRAGQSELELSPEEERAVELALDDAEPPPAASDRDDAEALASARSPQTRGV
jgi:Protein of unknown function (DUF4446)